MEFQRQASRKGGYLVADELEAAVLRAKAQFDDAMRIEHGITGKELLVGVMKNGVYEERMAEAKRVEQEQ